jgi:hypothetical protein
MHIGQNDYAGRSRPEPSRLLDLLSTPAPLTVCAGVGAQGTTVTGHLPAFRSRTASEPTSR